MKRIILLGLVLATVTTCGAQPIADEGWFRAAQPTELILPPDPDIGQILAAGVQTAGLLGSPTNPSIAEVVTLEIQALAQGLQNDPVRIFKYVHDNIRHVLYFGSKKGAQLTLLEKSGNDFDQCALLVALLRVAGFTNNAGTDKGVGYQFGWELLPYDSPNHNDLHHWLGLSLTNNNWTNTASYLGNLFYTRGYSTYYYSMTDTNTFWFQRVWVKATIGTTNYYLDPAFKVSEPVAGISLASAMGFSSNAVMNAAAGAVTGNYVTNLNETALRNALTAYTTNLLGFFQSNHPNASVEQILGGQSIVSWTNATLATGLIFPYYQWNQAGAVMPIVNWNNVPTNLMSTFGITFAGTNYQGLFPQLQGQRLSLTFDASGLAQLWQDDSLLAQKATSGSSGTTNVSLLINHPFGAWDLASNLLLNSNRADQVALGAYQRTNATYAIIYAFEPDWGWLQARQNQLENYLQQGLSNTSRPVVGETLNVMGLNWMLQSARAEQLFAEQLNCLPQWHHRVGRMAQETGKGYYVDVYAQMSGEFRKAGDDPVSLNNEDRAFELFTYFGSALEYGIIEQLQNTNIVGASTIKMLQLANAKGQAIYLASSTNWTAVSSKLVNYSSGTLATMGSFITGGYRLLVPQNGSNYVAGTSGWAGHGYAAVGNTSSNQDIRMFISGDYHGGYPSVPGEVNTSTVDQNAQAQPSFTSVAPTSTPNPLIADPVDTANGTFQVEGIDLSLGQAEPRGLNLSRYYNSRRRFMNPAGMANGWLHNYNINAATVSAAQAGLGGTTPPQMAPLLAATCAAAGIYNNLQPNSKNWMVTALIAKWGVDQLTKNGVSFTLGKDTVQFVQQPDGRYTPPANSTLTLLATNSVYWLQERQGRTFKFDTLGRLTNLVDQYSQSLRITYNASNRVQTVTDWKGRALTFNYAGSQLTSVADSPGGRSVSYGYNGQGDLTSVTDPENKTSTFAYDTNHQITATFDALNRLVVTNFYDGFGRVQKQYAQGDTNKTWQIFWSGWQTVEQDPAGSQRVFFYDNNARLLAERNALGHLAQTAYDGQNHIVMRVSPLNETNQFTFDGRHNLIQTVDPLGGTNQFIYDSQNNLTRSVDARGHASTFGYNAQFSLTGSTNGAGDWTTFSYNTDGTLAARTDAGGTTSYGYDSYGQLNSVTHPGGLGAESFGNSALGNVTNHTDARGFATGFAYDKRRQLTNTVAPTNRTTRASFDAVGNIFNRTDARGFSTTHTWSPTRHLLATVLPQGSMITNVYDARDWLVKTIDPLQHATLYTNDAAQRLVSATDPLGRTTRFGYDADGRRTATTNAANQVTRQQWNARSEAVQATDNAGHTVQYAYDAAGNQIILTNRNGKKWQFQFDAANRLTNTITPLGRTTTLTFDNRGLLKTLREPSGQMTTNHYDAKGRLTNRVDGVASTIYQYDANDNVTGITNVGQASRLSQSFDAYDRMTSHTNADGHVIQYRYDQNGNVTNLIYPGNKTVTYFYDSLNRLTNVTDWSGRKTVMTYDLASQLKSIARPNGTSRTIDYDAAGQTTNILEKTALGYPIALFRFNWNVNATMQWEFAAPLPHANTPPTRTMEFDEDNRLKKFNSQWVTNDLDGNLTSGPLTNTTFATYTYDARNRLTQTLNSQLSTNSYSYDPAGNRVAITNGANVTRLVINPNAALSQVLMRVKSGVTNYYIYGVGLLYEITETTSTTNTLTYHFDFRGSTVALTDDSGRVTDRVEYSAYGLTTYRTGTSDTPFLFNGRYGVMTDPNGLLFMRARYYNPYLCRFINADPSGFSGGLNFYAYANGNPVSYLDPFGLGAVGEGGWGSQFASWIDRNATGPLNSVSTSSTLLNYFAYNNAALVGGFADLFRLGEGTANATYNARNGWDMAIGVSQDITRAAGIAGIAGGGIAGAFSGGAKSAFFSGEGSFQVANQSGRTLLSDTLGGKIMTSIEIKTGYQFSPQTWGGVSRIYAANASGEVPVFLREPLRPNNIWQTFEKPTLDSFGNTTLIYK